MGHIKEPKGVDFIIKSEPLTDKEQAAISEFIKNYKIKHAKKKGTISRKSTTVITRKKFLA
ncbi:MAG: hypothetical protein JWQ30_2751 [Sediminibacterium sp.]|nr:hypothetical protein [Sediminibacterium sp.]